jgi:hypothetical protein
MLAPQRYNFWALLPVFAGLCWLNAGSGWGLIFTIWPGALLLSSGVALLLMPGDPRITRMMAVGGLLGMLLGLFFWAFDNGAFLGALLSVGSFVLAGREGLRLMPEVDNVPLVPREIDIYARTALDEALLGYFSATASVPGGGDADDCIEALKAQRAAVQRLGFDRDAAGLHQRPEPPDHVEWQPRRALGQDFRVLHFDSDFAAHPEIPGADHYMAYESNRQTAAWVFEHEGEDRPWLLCVHGYRMGHPLLDFSLFPPKVLHEKYGLNLLMPVLPLHGPRRAGRRTGDQFLDGDLRDLFHAECQTLWDLRRHLAWLRARGAQRIGALGFSLGGYNTALLAGFEQLDFAIAGIPVSDLPSVLWPNQPDLHQKYFAQQGADPDLLREVLTPVSPLARACALPVQRRYVFGGLADRLVPPAEVAKLAAHWQVTPHWYPGGHVTFRGSGIVMRTLREAMQMAEWPRR